MKKEIIIYDLTAGRDDSSQYYADIAGFTEEFLRQKISDSETLLSDYIDFLRKGSKEDLRTKEEYFLDILLFGLYYRLYLKYASGLHLSSYLLIKLLVSVRKRSKRLKKLSDKIRGYLSTFLLLKEGLSGDDILKNMSLLLRWLDATNEFEEEVKRFRFIKSYLQFLSQKDRNILLQQSDSLVVDFSEKFQTRFSQYLPNLEKFLKEKQSVYRFREDLIFVSKKSGEYYVSMFAAELLNRSFREKYQLTDKRAVLLPACMRFRHAEKCKAVFRNFDYICSGCDENCTINRLTQKGRKENYAVYIIPHSGDFSKWLKTWAVDKNIGVIGVACPLNLIKGGLELRALDIPSQCVLLDYCGCNNHWDEKGFPTALNEKILEEYLHYGKL